MICPKCNDTPLRSNNKTGICGYCQQGIKRPPLKQRPSPVDVRRVAADPDDELDDVEAAPGDASADDDTPPASRLPLEDRLALLHRPRNATGATESLTVEACNSCPLSDAVMIRCQHPHAMRGARCPDVGLPKWCPLVQGPLTIRRSGT